MKSQKTQNSLNTHKQNKTKQNFKKQNTILKRCGGNTLSDFREL